MRHMWQKKFNGSNPAVEIVQNCLPETILLLLLNEIVAVIRSSESFCDKNAWQGWKFKRQAPLRATYVCRWAFCNCVKIMNVLSCKLRASGSESPNNKPIWQATKTPKCCKCVRMPHYLTTFG